MWFIKENVIGKLMVFFYCCVIVMDGLMLCVICFVCVIDIGYE